MNWRRVRRIARRVWAIAGAGFLLWLIWSFQAHGLPADTFETNTDVRVDRVGSTWRFSPVGAKNSVGLVFLPGGMVDPKAYAPLVRALASAGYPSVLVELPWRLAPSDEAERTVAERAHTAMADMDAFIPWVLAGHSRGAAIATRLIDAGAAGFAGLALIGTTHPRVDLSGLTMPVLKIGGSRDCVAPRDRSETSAPNLPASAEWLWIEGANHAQFGFYGSQLGDCRARITRTEQQLQTTDALRRFLDRVAVGQQGGPGR